MSKVKVKLNKKEVGKQILHAEGLKIELERIASDVVKRTGGDYFYSTHDSGQRLITNIFPNSREAAHDNYKNNTLVRSL